VDLNFLFNPIKMKYNILKVALLFILLIFADAMSAQEKNEFEKQHEMKTYYMVFLKKGPNRNQDSLTAEKLQEQHIAHLSKMVKEGKMDICGPLTDDVDVRGICIYNVNTKEEAEKLVNEDPMIKAGRLIAEIHPFYSAKGATLK
jgi:uncharacterized protein YciI